MLPPKQYYLTPTRPESVPEGYRTRSVADWHFVFDESYDSIPVVADTDHVGHVIGTVLDIENHVEDGKIRLEDARSGALVTSFQNVLSDLAGRYVAFIDADGSYLYTDPAGALPLVYDSTERVAGTIPMVLPRVDAQSRFRSELFDRLNYEFENIWLPGELTYYSGINRLLPNHRLDLRTWETSRYWPSDPAVLTISDDPESLIASISSTLREVLSAVVASYDSPIMSLTAGKDTRVLVAGARQWVADRQIKTFTWDFGERYDVDIDVAQSISSDHGFDWTPVPIVSATDSDKERWLDDTGHAVGGTILEIHPTLERITGDVQINGFGGEIGRGYYWSESDEPGRTFSPTELLDRLHRPPDPVLKSAVQEWYDGVKQFDAFTQLDLMYQELRLGCWAGPHHSAMAQHRDFVGPLYYRPIVHAMYRLPPDIRRNDTLAPRVVDQLWPELNEYPYTAYDDWRDQIRMVKELQRKTRIAMTRPVRAGSYLIRQLSKR